MERVYHLRPLDDSSVKEKQEKIFLMFSKNERNSEFFVDFLENMWGVLAVLSRAGII